MPRGRFYGPKEIKTGLFRVGLFYVFFIIFSLYYTYLIMQGGYQDILISYLSNPLSVTILACFETGGIIGLETSLLFIATIPDKSGNPYGLYFSSVVLITYVALAFYVIPGIVKIRRGFTNYPKEVRIGRVGTSLILICILLYMMSFGYLVLSLNYIVPSVDFSLFTYSFLLLTLLYTIGQLLLGIGLYRVGRIYRSGLLKVGGVLIAIPVTHFIPFIGYILSRLGIEEVMDNGRGTSINRRHHRRFSINTIYLVY
ncbi:hypothetical protein SUSAZ_09945 [Sulfolobus acidocaldarius SUSAZ]|nr:hypothetical protein SUSAZ_09945 [Sulfolobus acidocaldarius SUSAZ]